MLLLHSLLLPATVRRKGSMDRTLKTLLSATFSWFVSFVFSFLILQWRNEDKKKQQERVFLHTWKNRMQVAAFSKLLCVQFPFL